MGTSYPLPTCIKKHSWNVQLVDYYDQLLCIGIINTDAKEAIRPGTNPNKFSSYYIDLCFGTKSEVSKKTNYDWPDDEIEYGHYTTDLDMTEVEVVFDQEKRTLEFVINGISQGIAFDDIDRKGEYRLYVEQIGVEVMTPPFSV